MSSSSSTTETKRSGEVFKTMQKVGKAFMLPIAILPAAGLLLGIGGALSNPTTVATYPVLDNQTMQGIFKVMNDAGSVVFANLALLLTIGLAIGLAKRDKGTAALAAVVGYFIFTTTIGSLLAIFTPDGKPIDTGIIGALCIGSVAVFLHNRFHNIQLPPVLGFFGGSRFVPIVTAFAAMFLGAIFFIIWPPAQAALVTAGEAIANFGSIGTFLYGFLLRLSGAFGLHHMIYPLFWFTPLGGTEVVNGVTVEGAQKIFFAQLADPTHTGLYTEGTKYFAGRFDTMMFGLPGAGLAMYHAIPKERRAGFGGLFFGVAATSFITGITEPIEFMFLFVSPLLYVFHAFLDGCSFLIADLLQIRIGNTFSGGAIDFTLFGILQGQDRTHWMYVIPVGIAWFFLYYFSFLFFIKKFNIGTPGRLDEDAPMEEAPAAAAKGQAKAEGEESELTANARIIITGLGGPSNIQDVDACITRLRVSVHDSAKVNKALLKAVGAIDVLDVAGGVQAIYGGKAVLYKSEINGILGHDD